MNSIFLLIALILVIGLCIGLAFLQVYLSKLSNKIWGLILPILWFLIFLPATIINIIRSFYSMFSLGSLIATLIMFIFFNIPTVVYVFIYIFCKGEYLKSTELKRMQIQDLE